jgi:hypothetical protein
MRRILERAGPADLEYVARLLAGRLGFAGGERTRRALRAFRRMPSPRNKRALVILLEQEFRYAGSADLAYLFRSLSGRPGGVGCHEIVADVARKLDVKIRPIGPLEDKLERLTRAVAERGLLELSPAEQRKLFRAHGAGLETARELRKRLKRHGPAAVMPILLVLLGREASEKLVTGLVMRQIGWLVGRDAARVLLERLAARFPWWAEWVGPIAWSVSGALVTLDLQGPAYRKTIPVTLYAGLCVLREREARKS